MVSSGSLALTSTSSKHVATAGPKAFEDNSFDLHPTAAGQQMETMPSGAPSSLISAHPDEIEALWAHVIAGEPED
jgi:hypothetical protein